METPDKYESDFKYLIYFFDNQNFLKRKINEQSFSNPHPRTLMGGIVIVSLSENLDKP